VQDYLEFASNVAGGAHTLAAYPHDFVLIERGSPAVKLMDSQRDWRLIYSDDTARLYARANSPAARLEGVPIAGASGPSMFP
jgi:predicted mannosyl-3-phosphoglycerate phosphatase (HAD superfamily)